MNKGEALRRGPAKPATPPPEPDKPVATGRPHLRREDVTDHTLCGYPITPEMVTYTIEEAMKLSRAGQALPLCASCIGRFQRIRA